MKKQILTFLVALNCGILLRAADQPTQAFTKEGREARKSQAINRFDLNGDGKLDHAERNLLRADLRTKIDDRKKRIIVPKNVAPVPLPR